MRTVFLSLMMSAPLLLGQAPAPPTSATPARPAAPAPPRRTAPVAGRAAMAIAVTDPKGATLRGVHVEVIGSSDRSGDTDANGQINFTGMLAGTYRLRFSGDAVIPFEREIAIRAGQTADVDVALNPAPERPEPPSPAPAPPAVAPAAPVGPAGKPQIVSIVNMVERDLIGNSEPRRETLVACSGNTRTTLVQLNQNQPDRLHEGAEVTYYVVAGEGAVRVNDRETALTASSFVSLPRGTLHSLVRRGRRPFIVLATLSGTPCEEAR